MKLTGAKQLKRELKVMSIDEYVKFSKKVIQRPEFQRNDDAWDTSRRKNFMRALLQNKTVAPIVIGKIISEEEQPLYLIDALQRTTCFNMFINDSFKIEVVLDKKTVEVSYSDLKDSELFNAVKLNVEIISCSVDEAAEIFININENGGALTIDELRPSKFLNNNFYKTIHNLLDIRNNDDTFKVLFDTLNKTKLADIPEDKKGDAKNKFAKRLMHERATFKIMSRANLDVFEGPLTGVNSQNALNDWAVEQLNILKTKETPKEMLFSMLKIYKKTLDVVNKAYDKYLDKETNKSANKKTEKENIHYALIGLYRNENESLLVRHAKDKLISIIEDTLLESNNKLIEGGSNKGFPYHNEVIKYFLSEVRKKYGKELTAPKRLSANKAKKLKEEVYEKQGGVCAISGVKIDKEDLHKYAAADHTLSVYDGGKHLAENIQVVYNDINLKKGRNSNYGEI